MSRVTGRTAWLAFACLAAFVCLICLAGPPAAQAEDTVWICKPGQSDDLCAGTIEGTTGNPPVPLSFTRPEDPPVDCFYIYPTVSAQKTPNANLDKDPEVRRVVVQQARMFSRVCKMYAPMYRQETSPGVYTAATEVAYQSALSAWKDYLANYNKGRGVLLLGHSQGSATVGRLIDEEVDPKPEVRKLLVGAMLPGANIHVRKGQLSGGMYDNVPACSEPGEYGCLVAYSMFNGYPGDFPPFGTVNTGYWAYKIPRPDPAEYEVVCTDPAQLSQSGGKLTALVNFDYLLTPPEAESATPWQMFPDVLNSSCKRQGNAHWLDVDPGPDPDPFLMLLLSQVASGNNYHVPEVNLAEENLVQIAQNQIDGYVGEENRIANLKAKLKKLNGNLAKAKKRLAANQKQAKKLAKKARKAKGNQKKKLNRKAKVARKKTGVERKRISSLQKQIAQTKKQLG